MKLKFEFCFYDIGFVALLVTLIHPQAIFNANNSETMDGLKRQVVQKEKEFFTCKTFVVSGSKVFMHPYILYKMCTQRKCPKWYIIEDTFCYLSSYKVLKVHYVFYMHLSFIEYTLACCNYTIHLFV